jgi:UDP-glucuronate 4-epimerase
MTKILLTGAAGFIGSHVAECLLSHGHEVTGIDNFDDFYSRSIKEQNVSACLKNPSFTFIEANVGDVASLFPDINFDVVIHLAAKAGVRPSWPWTTNERNMCSRFGWARAASALITNLSSIFQ